MADGITALLSALEGFDREALRARWSEAFGRPAPKRASRDLLLRTLAYHLQERMFGGLSLSTRRQLAKVLKGPERKSATPRAERPKLRPGTRLVREWRGRVHEIEVLADGFVWRGAIYRSLSTVAREITGTRWSGPRFFGLKREPGDEVSGHHEA